MAKVDSDVSELTLSRAQILSDGPWESVIDVEEISSKKTPEDVVETARRAFATGKTKPLKFRQAQLRGLLRFLEECKGEIERALYKVSLRIDYQFI